MLILTGFFDETGDLPDTARKLNGMAGFVTTCENWAAICDDWAEHIKTQQYTCYHDVDIQGSKRKEKRRKPLLDILDKYWVVPLAYFVSMDTLRSLSLGEQILFGDPYYHAFAYCFYLATTLSIVNTKTSGVENTKVLAVFDRKNEKFRQEAAKYYDYLINRLPGTEHILEVPSYRSSENFIPLCMADMLASVLREEYERQLYRTADPETESYKRILTIADKGLDAKQPEKNYRGPFVFLHEADELRAYIPDTI